MAGFFTKKETQSISAVGGKIHSCASCGLYQNCSSPKMKPFGAFGKKIMIIGEAPGMEEDEAGKTFQGRGGRLLAQVLQKAGIDLFTDCISLNAINCFPNEKRGPTPDEINHCRSIIVWPAIQRYQPDIIIPLGGAAMRSVVGHRYNGSVEIKKFRSYQIPDQELKAWVCPTYHPNYLLYKDKPSDMMRLWLDDIKAAVDKIGEKVPLYKTPEIEVVNDLSFLNDFPENQPAAFDYETTGIKPHAKGHRIASCSISTSPDHAWAFVGPKRKKDWQPFRRWLANPRIPKIAQNIKYENNWSRELLKVPVRNWMWDTMLATHVLNNKTTKSLKFQTYVNFGIVGYEEDVSRYLKSSDEFGDNTLNDIMKLLGSSSGTKQLLTYNGLDSAYEYRLAMRQMRLLNFE